MTSPRRQWWQSCPSDNHKHVTRAVVAGTLGHTIEQLDRHHHKVGGGGRAELDVARQAPLAS